MIVGSREKWLVSRAKVRTPESFPRVLRVANTTRGRDRENNKRFIFGTEVSCLDQHHRSRPIELALTSVVSVWIPRDLQNNRSTAINQPRRYGTIDKIPALHRSFGRDLFIAPGNRSSCRLFVTYCKRNTCQKKNVKREETELELLEFLFYNGSVREFTISWC